MNFELFIREVSYYGTWALGLGALLVVAVFLWFLGLVWLKYVLEKTEIFLYYFYHRSRIRRLVKEEKSKEEKKSQALREKASKRREELKRRKD